MTTTIRTGSTARLLEFTLDTTVSQPYGGRLTPTCSPDPQLERAHELCVEALKDSPDGGIPLQTVYEMLLKIIGREDVIAAIDQDYRDLLGDRDPLDFFRDGEQ